ncbi:MAG TPA: hypothetical protein VFV91_06090 [Gaiellaceae bacterium]|nr:hypothetical protein [Gaiellaceae bacterium]
MSRMMVSKRPTGDPDLRQTPTGWLAVSGEDALIRIGVVAASAEDARREFESAAMAWARLRLLPDPFAERVE